LAGSVALAQERERGSWPACFDDLWQAIACRSSATEAAKQMVEVIMLSVELDPKTVEHAVQGALAAGAHDGRAVALLARKLERPPAPKIGGLDPGLARLTASEPDLADYDQLLARAA
jgi:23S rRNA G2445 N2-methylase RlmL